MTTQTTKQRPQKTRTPKKTIAKNIWKKFWRTVDKALTFGEFVFDYGVKVGKSIVLLVGVATAAYVAKEMPNRTETDTIGSVAGRAVNNLTDDINSFVRKKCQKPPRGQNVYPKKEYQQKTTNSSENQQVPYFLKKRQPFETFNWAKYTQEKTR